MCKRTYLLSLVRLLKKRVLSNFEFSFYLATDNLKRILIVGICATFLSQSLKKLQTPSVDGYGLVKLQCVTKVKSGRFPVNSIFFAALPSSRHRWIFSRNMGWKLYKMLAHALMINRRPPRTRSPSVVGIKLYFTFKMIPVWLKKNRDFGISLLSKKRVDWDYL